MPELSDDLPEIESILKSLNEAGVRYVVIGGVAMRLHGAAHRTDDFDVFYGREGTNLRAVVQAPEPYKPRLRGAPEGLPFFFDERTLKNGLNFTFATDVGAVDLLGDTGSSDFEGVWSRSVEFELNGIPLRLASLDDLIAMKRAANRPKDQNHIMELEALKRLIAEGGGAS